MRFFYGLLFGAIGFCAVMPISYAGITIDSSHDEASASILFSQNNGFTDSSSFKSILDNNSNQTLGIASKNLSLDDNGVGGQGSYSFNVRTDSVLLIPEGRYNLGVSTDQTYSVSSNNPTLISSSEDFHAILNFTITGQSYLADIVDVQHQLSSPLSASFNSLVLNGSLQSTTLGTLYQVSQTLDNTGAMTFNSNFPSSLTLAPGSYSLEMDISGTRNGLYDLSNIHGLGAISLSMTPIAAVPEPSSLVILISAGAYGSWKMRRSKRARSNA